MYKLTIVQEVVVGGMVRESNTIHLYFKEFSEAIILVHAIYGNPENDRYHTYCILSKDRGEDND